MVNLPRSTRVENKTPAPIQITAEQILREARELHEAKFRPRKQRIMDATELGDYRLRKRKAFEDSIRRPWKKSVWVKYAQWEELQKDYARARSVWERALEVDYGDHTLWLKYANFEMKNKFINHARNIWDRATQLLPRVDQLWYEYIHMEEKLGNVAGARQIFERWMAWMPDQQGWLSYIKFELRYKEVERARAIFKRAVGKLGDDGELSGAFAEIEEKYKETEWLNMESTFGEHGDVDLVGVKLPKKLKKRRYIETEDGVAGCEEDIDDRTKNLRLRLIAKIMEF